MLAAMPHSTNSFAVEANDTKRWTGARHLRCIHTSGDEAAASYNTFSMAADDMRRQAAIENLIHVGRDAPHES